MDGQDYKTAFTIGIASSVLWFFVLYHLSLVTEGELIALVILLPFAFIFAVAASHAMFRSPVFHKFVKFIIIGILNSGIDFFVFNTLIVATQIDRGWPITLWKSISFSCAMVNSYLLNRSWAFDEEASPTHNKKEFARFAAVTAFGFLINVGVTTIIVNAVPPALGMSQIRWDNIAAILATSLNLLWNFAGYKFFVFANAI